MKRLNVYIENSEYRNLLCNIICLSYWGTRLVDYVTFLFHVASSL